MKKSNVPEGSLQHVYKRSVDGGVIFYRTIDHLVYFSLQSVMARKHNLKVLCIAHMYTHLHGLLASTDPCQLSSFERDLNIVHTREYNKEMDRTGRLYHGPFGAAPKRTEKDKRSSLIYVINNPVEKKLCSSAMDDRWTFLAYYERTFPFSERPSLKTCRWVLRNAFRVVDQEYNGGRYLKYVLLHHLFAPLNDVEREQLTDYIIQRYYFFDNASCYRLFGGWEKMVTAIDMTKGKEFDVGEEFDPFSDIPYREMCDVAEKFGLLAKGMPLFSLPEVRLKKLAEYLKSNTSASDYQVAKFLHHEFER